MKNVGFYGGSLICDLGSASDMRTFFGCVGLAASQLPNGGSLLTDRLYRRYLRLEELDPAATLLEQVRDIMVNIPTDSVDWESLGWDATVTNLTMSAPNLSQTMGRYLDSAQELISEARGFEKRFHIYKPVITIITDTPKFYVEKRRPLAEYDALEGEPMWLR
jgi:hypothetical protein